MFILPVLVIRVEVRTREAATETETKNVCAHYDFSEKKK